MAGPRRRSGPGVGDLALFAALVALIAWPAAATVLQALRDAGPVGGGGLFDPELAGSIGRPLGLAMATARVTLAAEAIALPIGVALALLVVRTDLPGRGLLRVLLALAVFVPLPLHATAWLGAVGNLGRSQAIGTTPLLVGWSGAAFVHAMAALPWVVLLVGVGLASVEPELEEAARLDRPGWWVVGSVTLRRAVGSIAAAALAVAVLTAGDMTVTDLVRPAVRTYAEEAYVQAQLGSGPTAAARVALPPLAVLGVLIALGAWWLRRSDPARLASAATAPRRWRLGRWRWPLAALVLAMAGGAVAVPLYGLIWRAGRVAGRAARGEPPHWSAAGLLGTLERAWPDVAEPSVLPADPLRSPLVATTLWGALAAALAVGLAWGLAWKCRGSRVWGVVTASAVAMLLAAPGPVVGLALKLAYLQVPPVHDTAAIVVLALVARVLPFAVLVVWPAVRGLPPELLDAAAVAGYGPTGRALVVGLPMTRWSIAGAWAVAFVLACGELPASNLVLPPGLMTLPMRVWSLLHTGVESHLAGVGLILVVLYGGLSLAAAWMLGRALAGGRAD